jgi:hypothetical protein
VICTIVAIALACTLTASGGGAAEPIRAIRTSAAQRMAYLSHAVIWREPPVLSPRQLRDGPIGVFPFSYERANAAGGIACTFTKPGRELGGASLKFLCDTADGQTLRVKYWDPKSDEGNREVFASVAASRLMWALGFSAPTELPVRLTCRRCPENPMKGEGAVATRRYLGVLSAPPQHPVIVSADDLDQGWSWRELDEAIRFLPPGGERTRQRRHFDALTLLGVFLQHGDRKPEQQMLVCDGGLNPASGKRGPFSEGDDRAALFERPAGRACRIPAVAVGDLGATFGGAGRTSDETTAKMNLEHWRVHPVLKYEEGVCRGVLTISLAAGSAGQPNPVISEEGRVFLLQQLNRLKTAHLRALFQAARVTDLQRVEPGLQGNAESAWVAAFHDKVRQLESQRCSSTRS